jgi:streptothricin acetyltransferase
VAIQVRKLDQSLIPYINQVDGSLWVDSRLQLSAVDGKIRYTVVPVEGYLKPYMPETIDANAYLDNPGRAIFLAYLDGKLAGQIILRRNWNLYAWVEDIAVDAACRKQGVGQALMKKAVEWAHQREMPGIMLETQDIRVAACRFYERFGFELGGFDRCLYRATLPGSDEIALFWYLWF